MVVARIARFHFKIGKREEGFSELDLILNKHVRSAKGFQGFVSLFSCDQENVAMILTIWENEESYLGSKEIFSSAVNRVESLLEKQPDVEYCRVDSVNLVNSLSSF